MIKFPGLLLGREPRNENEESGDKKAKAMRQVQFTKFRQTCRLKKFALPKNTKVVAQL